jgi:hypothetical protein
MLYSRSRSYLVALSIALGTCVALPAVALQAQAKSSQAKHQSQNAKAVRCVRCKERKLPNKKEYTVYHNILKQSSKTQKAIIGKNNETTPDQVHARACGGEADRFQRVCHFLHEDTSRLGDIITIQDGSQWSVSEQDHDTVKSWSVNAPVTFAPNLSVWNHFTGHEPKHKYKAINLDTGDTVEVNLSQGPYTSSKHVKRIHRINKAKGEIYLSNGTLWKCANDDAAKEVFNEWKAGDYLIPGTNDTWYSFQKQDIMINVSADNWLPAQRTF